MEIYIPSSLIIPKCWWLMDAPLHLPSFLSWASINITELNQDSIAAQLLASKLECSDGTTMLISKASTFSNSSSKIIWGVVNCEADTDVYAFLQLPSDSVIWLNRHPILGYRTNFEDIYSFKLNNGINLITIHLPSFDQVSEICIRIERTNVAKAFPALAVDNFLCYKKGSFCVHDSGTDAFQKNGYHYTLYPMDGLNFNSASQISLTIYSPKTQKILITCNNVLFQQYYYARTELIDLSKDESVIFKFQNKHSNIILYEIEKEVYLYDIKQLAFTKTARFLQQYNNDLTPRNMQDAYNYILKQSTMNTLSPIELINLVNRVKKSIIQELASNLYSKNLYNAGCSWIFYHSAIDDETYYYQVKTPIAYAPEKKYPVLFIISVYETKNRCPHFINIPTYENLIVVDVPSRALLLGSYTSMAVINEVFDDLISKYNIDSSRVYAMGYSSGAGAAWSQVQHIPDRYAGAYVAAGYANNNMLCNVLNTKMISLLSETDQLTNLRSAHIEISKYSNSVCMIAHMLAHSHLSLLYYNKTFINQLLHVQKESYPKHIRFKTDKHRFLDSFWIHIHSILQYKRFAEVEAMIESNSVYLNCKNITGISIDLPPQSTHKQYSIFINGVHISSVEYSPNKVVHFLNHKNSFYMTESRTSSSIDIYKGHGLLDVYATPMRIILDDSSNQHLVHTAKVLSSPRTNSFIPEMMVRYPILGPTHIPKVIKHFSLIILTSIFSIHNYSAKIAKLLPISMNVEGYTYLGNTYSGPYCIMQVINNPENPQKSILYICTNDDKLLKRNIFTRSLILPTYSSGFHPYLNNAALIFHGEKYYSVFEYGLPITSID